MSVDLDAVKPYQKAGVVFLTRQPYAMIGDDTGLGKSVQCILAAEALRYRRILVICPLIGVVSWRIELARWMLTKREFRYFTSKDPAIPNGPLVYVLPYSTLSVQKLREKVLDRIKRAAPFDAVIVDEAHHLSNFSSQRTMAVYGKWCSYAGGVIDFARPKSVWLLSGTIQRRDARDLYPHLKCLFPQAINRALNRPDDAQIHKRDFDEEFLIFTENYFGRQPIGNDPATIPRLRTAMKPFVIARRKRDVAPELGKIQRFDLPLGLDNEDPYYQAVKRPGFGDALWTELKTATDLHRALVLSETAAEERRILGMIKVRPCRAWCFDWFASADEGEKLVVFAWHRDVIREMQEALSIFNPVTIMGGVSDSERRDAVDTFQHDPTCRVFIGQTVAAGTSITLTASSNVLMMEPDWLPHNDHQAVSRVHRLGQSEPVFCWRAYADNTVDARIIDRANARLRDFEQLMDGLVEPAA